MPSSAESPERWPPPMKAPAYIVLSGTANCTANKNGPNRMVRAASAHSHQSRLPCPLLATSSGCEGGSYENGELLSLAAAATRASTATTTTPVPAASIAASRPSTPAAGNLARRHRRAFGTVEVRLVVLVDLLRLILVEVLAALDQDRALVRPRLLIVEFVPRLRRRWNWRLYRCRFGGRCFHRRLLRQLRLLLADQRLAAQLDAVAFDRQHLHHHLVAFAQLVLHFLHPMLGNFGNVQQPVRAREQFHKRSELRQPHHLAQVNLAHLGHSGDVADNFQRPLQSIRVGRRHAHLAGVIHVDLGARLLHDPANRRATLADQVADLVRGNHDRLDARRVLRLLHARTAQFRIHLVQKEEPSLSCL